MSQFKARKINKKIFERPSALPVVEKKDKTGFNEFKISKSNKAPKSIEESSKDFKALPLNKKLLQGQLFKPVVPEEKHSIEQQPFNLKTDERSKTKDKKLNEEETVVFKAREMPTYKFFEPKKVGK